MNHTLSIALGVLLLCSAMLNVAQYAQRPGAASLGQGWGMFPQQQMQMQQMPSRPQVNHIEDPLQDGRCNGGLVHMCVDEASAVAVSMGMGMGMGMAGPFQPMQPMQQMVQPMRQMGQPMQQMRPQPQSARSDVARMGQDMVHSGGEAEVGPREDAQFPAEGGVRYCRKDTWLLSCLFYKADVADELTDWKSVKAECDREPLCDGVNKYWTSDLWHISSSGEAPGCDENLRDGNGTDASAFYKEGSRGWLIYTRDGTCHEVDEWGNPKM